ncbi:MAG: type VI secretion system baseplate subunit TssG [Syntrophobacterales bacterium]|nr:type VI secretion system baseplate subunit TssG [Syntrophobacterales bacterium]
MASEDGGQASDLKSSLLKEGRRYSFTQALRLLHYVLQKKAGPGVHEQGVEKRIRVRPELSLAFPETDVASIEEFPDRPGRFLVTATFLGLYGTSSPLPTFYTEDLLLERARDQSVSRDFIDIFNARLYSLYFRCWSKYRLFFNLVEEIDQEVLERLYCLIGLGGKKLRESVENPHEKIRYAGLMTQLPRCAEGLKSLLADVLHDPAIQIIQCVERTVEIPEEQRFILGVSGNLLGEDAYVGSDTYERLGKFRVCIGPLTGEDFNRYLPDKPIFHRLKSFIGFYLDQPLAWDVEAVLIPGEAATTKFGDEKRCRLGWNTWLFSDGFQPADTAVRFTDRGLH